MYKEKLEKEIVDQLSEVSMEEIGTDRYEKAVEGVSKLIDRDVKMKSLELEKRKIELEELKAQNEVEIKSLEIENDFKKHKIEKAVQIGLNGVAFVVLIGGVLYTSGLELGNRFTTSAGQAFVRKVNNLIGFKL